MVKYMAESGPYNKLRGAATVCAPLNLVKTSSFIEEAFCGLFSSVIAGLVKKKLADMPTTVAMIEEEHDLDVGDIMSRCSTV